jgi:hypothetical protein
MRKFETLQDVTNEILNYVPVSCAEEIKLMIKLVYTMGERSQLQELHDKMQRNKP